MTIKTTICQSVSKPHHSRERVANKCVRKDINQIHRFYRISDCLQDTWMYNNEITEDDNGQSLRKNSLYLDLTAKHLDL